MDDAVQRFRRQLVASSEIARGPSVGTRPACASKRWRTVGRVSWDTVEQETLP